MAEETDQKTDDQKQDTSAGDGKNTGSGDAGAGTQTAKKTAEAAQADITQTPEFKAALTSAIEKKLPQLRKQIAKEVSGEKEGQPSVEELKGRAETAETELRRYRARDQVEAYVSDKRNNVQVRNMRALVRFVEHDFEYDDEGKVTNLKDLIAQAKADAPELFGVAAGSADGGAGAHSQNGDGDMNARIRQAAGR